jgi:hypothetical protein
VIDSTFSFHRFRAVGPIASMTFSAAARYMAVLAGVIPVALARPRSIVAIALRRLVRSIFPCKLLGIARAWVGVVADERSRWHTMSASLVPVACP